MGDWLTPYQLEVLDYILDYMAQYDYRVAPTHREVAERFVVSTPAATTVIKTLIRKGYLTKEGDGHRNLRPCPEEMERMK